MGAIHVGTSGWSYPHWAGRFYPGDLPQRQWLGFYARHFATVEINNAFYRLPGPDTFAAWARQTPPGFLFAVKASRYITHLKKLKAPDEALARLLHHAAHLGDKLGPILFQLPPRWRCNPERLADFLQRLPRGHDYAFEFRDPSWFCEAVYGLLRDHGCAFCIYHLAGRQSPLAVTAPFVYIRLHGPDGPYQGRYGREGLVEWVEHIRVWAEEGRTVYCYFDNDQNAYAVEDARTLKRLLTP